MGSSVVQVRQLVALGKGIWGCREARGQLLKTGHAGVQGRRWTNGFSNFGQSRLRGTIAQSSVNVWSRPQAEKWKDPPQTVDGGIL